MAPKGSRGAGGSGGGSGAAAGGQPRSGKSAASLLDLLALEVLGTSTTHESRALAHSCLEVSSAGVWPTLRHPPAKESSQVQLRGWHAIC